MNWVLTALLCTALVELVLRLPFVEPLKGLVRNSRRAVHVVTAKAVSDHWKEKAMGAYAQRTFSATAKLTGCLLMVLGTAIVLVIAMEVLFNGFQAFILSGMGLGFSVVAATVYVMARKTIGHG